MLMSEFNDRMDAQRRVLEAVNRHGRFREELCGISRKAIERWIHANHINPTGDVAGILIKISSRLFFLSTKSQEQVAERYRVLSLQLQSLQRDLAAAIDRTCPTSQSPNVCRGERKRRAGQTTPH